MSEELNNGFVKNYVDDFFGWLSLAFFIFLGFVRHELKMDEMMVHSYNLLNLVLLLYFLRMTYVSFSLIIECVENDLKHQSRVFFLISVIASFVFVFRDVFIDVIFLGN